MQFSRDLCGPEQQQGISLTDHRVKGQTCPSAPDTLSFFSYMLRQGLFFMAVSSSVAIASTLISRSYNIHQHSPAEDNNVPIAPGGQQDGSGSSDLRGPDSRTLPNPAGHSDDNPPWPFQTFGITLGIEYVPGLGPLLETLDAWLDATSKAVPAALAIKLGSFGLSSFYALRILLARIDQEVCMYVDSGPHDGDQACSDGRAL